MEPRLRSKKFPPQAGLEPETARSVDQRLTQLSHLQFLKEAYQKITLFIYIAYQQTNNSET